jgi:LuxR family transcriptional regulator, maltose regulon positive regulatory protein
MPAEPRVIVEVPDLERSTAGSEAALLGPPMLRGGTVVRAELVERLLSHHSAPVVTVIAPPGYGKTTLVSQWVERDERRSAWLRITGANDDEPIAMASSVAFDPEPVLIVIDDIHRLRAKSLWEELVDLIHALPPESQLVLCGWSCPLPSLARLRAEGRVSEIGTSELTMDMREATEVWRRLGLRPTQPEIEDLLAETEGWPVAIYLAASHPSEAWPLRDYVDSEIFGGLTEAQVRFATRSSILPWMSGELCDAAIEPKRGTRMLRALEASPAPLFSIEGGRYRYQGQFREILRQELEGRESDIVGGMASRASTWFERNGLLDDAIDAAQAADDVDRVAALTVRDAMVGSWVHRISIIHERFHWIAERVPLGNYPFAAAIGACVNLMIGNATVAARLVETVARCQPDEIGPDGSSLHAWLLMLRAAMCRDGVPAAELNAEAALEELAPGSPWRRLASLTLGLAHVARGDIQAADDAFADAAIEASEDQANLATAIALAERALVAIWLGRWAAAEEFSSRASELVPDDSMGPSTATGPISVVAAWLAVHRGDVTAAAAALHRSEDAAPQLGRGFPSLAAQVHLEAARVYIALEDTDRARKVLGEAEEAVRRCSGATALVEEITTLRGQLDARPKGSLHLTVAERRLLPLLTTHLTFREIGEQIYLSPHTVKAEAISIYRKLGQTSRNGAIMRAREIGLIEN